MTTNVATRKLSFLQRFTALDLVTMAVFAALHRTMWYVWHALGMFFPYSMAINVFFWGLVVLGAVVIVRKPWTVTLVIVADMMIDLFLQGELLVAAAIICTFGLLADVYLVIRLRQGHDPYSSTKDLMIAGTLLSVVIAFGLFVVLMPYIYLVPIPAAIFWTATAVVIAAGIAGSWVGIVLGRRLSGLIG